MTRQRARESEAGLRSRCQPPYNIGVLTAFGALKFGYSIGNTMLDAVALVFPAANRALHHHVGFFAERARILGKLAEADDAVPFRATLPLAVGILHDPWSQPKSYR